MDLCEGKTLSTSITHATKQNEHLFLLFEVTHNMKNIFNNFLSRKIMYIPLIADDELILGGKCLAQFAHIK